MFHIENKNINYRKQRSPHQFLEPFLMRLLYHDPRLSAIAAHPHETDNNMRSLPIELLSNFFSHLGLLRAMRVGQTRASVGQDIISARGWPSHRLSVSLNRWYARCLSHVTSAHAGRKRQRLGLDQPAARLQYAVAA